MNKFSRKETQLPRTFPGIIANNRKPLSALFTLATVLTINAGRCNATVRVGIPDVPPCSEKIGDINGGWAYDLWNRVANKAGITHRIQHFSSAKEGIEALDSGSVDVLASCLTITPKRSANIDFSYPIGFEGVRLVQRPDTTSQSQVAFELFFNQVFSTAIILLILIAFIHASIITALETRDKSKIPPPLVSLGELFILTGKCLSGYKNTNNSTSIGYNSFVAVETIVRIVLIALVTGSSTRSLISMDGISVHFSSPTKSNTKLLPNMRYGVLDGSGEHELLVNAMKLGLRVKSIRYFTKPEQIGQAVLEKQIDYGFVNGQMANYTIMIPEFKRLLTIDTGAEGLQMPYSFGLSKNLAPSVKNKINQAIIEERLETQESIFHRLKT